MRYIKIYWSFFTLLLVSIQSLSGQNITFKTSAPSAVVKGETFRLSYTLKNGEGDNFQGPKEINGFEILYGPATSSSYSTQIINGKASSSSSKSYIYTLTANAQGSYTLPGAKIVVDGKSYKSNSISIKVLPPDKTTQNQSQSKQQNNDISASPSSTAGRISSSDAFIRTIVSKSKIKEQEAFIVTFRLYTTLDVSDIGRIEFPEFEGFMVEDIELSTNQQFRREHYNGRNYYVADLRKVLLFPQRAGEIIIPEGKIEIAFQVRSQKPVNTFLGPQYIMSNVPKTLKTSAQKINVSPLPKRKPESFSNAVGTFTMDQTISGTDIQANDPVTLTLTLSGTGNMKLIKIPEVKLPNDFESYDPKVTNDFKISENGLTGKKTIEYLFIPRYAGDYKIAPIEFSYFDTKSNTYKKVATPEYTLHVAKDPNAKNNVATSFTQNEVTAKQDIRYIKTRKPRFEKIDNFMVNSTSYYLWFIIPILIYILFFIINRKQIKENSNIILTKSKKANKIANKRLKLAKQYLSEHKKEQFYEETLRAVWGYLSDKLIIPVASLNRDNIETELIRKNVDKQLIQKMIQILDTCEFARYAPAESDTAMEDLYQETVKAIRNMENTKLRTATSEK